MLGPGTFVRGRVWPQVFQTAQALGGVGELHTPRSQGHMQREDAAQHGAPCCRAQGPSNHLMADRRLLHPPVLLLLSSASRWPPEDLELELVFCGGVTGPQRANDPLLPAQHYSQTRSPEGLCDDKACGSRSLGDPWPKDPRPWVLFTPDL